MILCPVDEGAANPGFAEYRERLKAAVARKDEAALLPLLASDIRVNFGGGGGITDFRKQWDGGTAGSPFWPELSSILEHGGSFIGEGSSRTFWAPYVYSRWPDDVDAFEHLAAVRAEVPLRSAPEDQAPLVRTLDWAIVHVLTPPVEDQPEWRHVKTADGAEGWVRTKDVRSPIGYRAGFGQVNGEWRMTALVAGD